MTNSRASSALANIFIYLVVILIVIAGVFFFFAIKRGAAQEYYNETEINFSVKDKPTIARMETKFGNESVTANATQKLQGITWQRKTIVAFLKMMGYDPDKGSQVDEGKAVFYATKKLIMVSLVLLGVGYSTIMMILFINKYLHKET